MSKQDGKNHRAAIEGTIREVKHPFPASKLPVRGLFRVTCLMVASAAMTNVRRIYHYLEAKRKAEKQTETPEQGTNHAQDQQGVSFSAFLKAILIGFRSSLALSETFFGF